MSRTALAYNSLLLRANFWLFSVMIKLVPSVILVFMTYRLVSVLFETKRRLRRLRSNYCDTSSPAQRLNSDVTAEAAARQADRTTYMLLVILVLFLITEFPQGIILLITGLSTDILRTCYLYLGDIMDMMALLNCSVNFPLYCVMSKQFRTTFGTVVLRKRSQVQQPEQHISLGTAHLVTVKHTSSVLL